jgi:hypothetical protein
MDREPARSLPPGPPRSEHPGLWYTAGLAAPERTEAYDPVVAVLGSVKVRVPERRRRRAGRLATATTASSGSRKLHLQRPNSRRTLRSAGPATRSTSRHQPSEGGLEARASWRPRWSREGKNCQAWRAREYARLVGCRWPWTRRDARLASPLSRRTSGCPIPVLRPSTAQPGRTTLPTRPSGMGRALAAARVRPPETGRRFHGQPLATLPIGLALLPQRRTETATSALASHSCHALGRRPRSATASAVAVDWQDRADLAGWWPRSRTSCTCTLRRSARTPCSRLGPSEVGGPAGRASRFPHGPAKPRDSSARPLHRRDDRRVAFRSLPSASLLPR